jgi:hypothetical protein
MSKICCFTCKAKTVLKCCSKCEAVHYCSKSCQKEDWKEHKQICQFLNVGDGAMQVQTDENLVGFEKSEEVFQDNDRRLHEDGKRFFKLFTESTLNGGKAAAREMKKIAARQSQRIQKLLLFHSISLLMSTDSKKLRWPNCPLRIMLQFVDANVRRGDSPEELARGFTPLHFLSLQASPNDHSFHQNQVILGQQLFRHGANANLGLSINGVMPLHLACNSNNVTNLGFIQLLLEKGANPNAHDVHEMTPVMATLPMAPGAAKFLLEWSTPPTTDIDTHITARSGVNLLGLVRLTIENLSDQDTLHDNSDQQIKHTFLLQQWREIEKMLVERGSH